MTVDANQKVIDYLKVEFPDLSSAFDVVDASENPTSCLQDTLQIAIDYYDGDAEAVTPSHVLAGAFSWMYTPQGDTFWRDIYNVQVQHENGEGDE